MPSHQKQSSYDDNKGGIRYLDGSVLKRPLTLQRPELILLGVFVIVAILIGGTLGFKVIDGVLGAPTRATASIEENLNRQVDLALPSLATYMQLDDETILNTFTEAGYTILNATTEEVAAAGVGMDIVKLPEGVSVEEAGVAYLQKIEKLPAAEAARLLNGSWRMTIDRSADNPDFRVKYADFTSGTVETAVQAAIIAGGLEGSSMGESGVDSSGNTYQTGTIDSEGTTYNWQVSVFPLSGIYSIDGLPDTAAYVGIRMYA